MNVLDWSQRTDLPDVTALEQALDGITEDAHVRIDLRFAHLPLAYCDVLVPFLRRVPGASVCVGNNKFTFNAFYNKLKEMSAVDLFEDDRFTLGWTEQERAIERMAARAHVEGRVLQLVDAIEAMREAHDRDHAKSLADVEASRKQNEASDKRADVIRSRVEDLAGYNINRDLCIEYAVTDVVDDMMQKLGYNLDEREHRVKLYDASDSNIGEIDGLLSYYRPHDENKRVVVAVEAKGNMTPDEFKKVHANIKKLKSAISTGMAAEGKTKYTRLCRSLSVHQGVKLLVAVGAPVVPAEVMSDAAQCSYLVVQGDREGQYKVAESSWTDWVKFLSQ
eukprot:365646-Chlamydomonas_euryale.AAC.1